MPKRVLEPPDRPAPGRKNGSDSIINHVTPAAIPVAVALQQAILSSRNIALIATDVNGVIQLFNNGAERMLGYSAAEVVDSVTPADLSDPQEVIARSKALSAEFDTPIAPGFEALAYRALRGIEDVYDITYCCRDETRLPVRVNVTALMDDRQVLIGFLLVFVDNSANKLLEDERMKLDQRVRDQQFYTRSLLEAHLDALVTTDPRGIITDANRQAELLTGSTRDELVGAPFSNVFTEPARAEAAIRRALGEGKVTEVELTARDRNGQDTAVAINATTFHDRNRTLKGVFVAVRDITERARIEHALQAKNLELEGASRLKSEFLANMSHELRTPLNAIIGFSEVLADGLLGELTEAQRRFVSDIYGSGTHLLSLINDILDLSKIESGKMSLDLERVPLASLFANSLSIIREKASTRRIRLEVDSAGDLGSVQVDPRKVKQVVYNLLANAVKFTGEGGSVTLRATRVPASDVGAMTSGWTGRTLPIAHAPCEEYIRITVTDSGIGIAEEALHRLFTPFSQIDSGLARRFEGTGLGLAMVRQLVELHEGTVAVESAVGLGSAFTVWLPLHQSGPVAATVTPRALRERGERGERGVRGSEDPSGHRMALVVEDDFKSADLIRVQLEAEGFSVLHAASAEAALVIAVQQPLALITLDIMLPNMDGWEFLSRIKLVAALRNIPVVIISIVADRGRGFALGAAAVMQKPLSRQDLYESLVGIGLFPVVPGGTLRVLVVDRDVDAVTFVADRIMGLATTVLRATGGVEAIAVARHEHPDLIVLALMTPEVNGFEVVNALNEQDDTAHIPIIVVTDEHFSATDILRLSGSVTSIMDRTGLDQNRLSSEIRRALTGRHVAN